MEVVGRKEQEEEKVGGGQEGKEQERDSVRSAPRVALTSAVARVIMKEMRKR